MDDMGEDQNVTQANLSSSSRSPGGHHPAYGCEEEDVPFQPTVPGYSMAVPPGCSIQSMPNPMPTCMQQPGMWASPMLPAMLPAPGYQTPWMQSATVVPHLAGAACMQSTPQQTAAHFQVQEAPRRSMSPMRVRASDAQTSIFHKPAPRASSPPKRPSRGRDSAAAGGGLFGPLRRGARGEPVAHPSPPRQSKASAPWEKEEPAIVKTLTDHETNKSTSNFGPVAGPDGTPGWPSRPVHEASQELTFTCQLPMVLVVD